MTTGPLAVPAGGHYPAGFVNPEAWEAAQRAALELEIAREEEGAAKAAREQAISERMAAIRGGQMTTAGAASEPEPGASGHDGEHEPVVQDRS